MSDKGHAVLGFVEMESEDLCMIQRSQMHLFCTHHLYCLRKKSSPQICKLLVLWSIAFWFGMFFSCNLIFWYGRFDIQVKYVINILKTVSFILWRKVISIFVLYNVPFWNICFCFMLYLLQGKRTKKEIYALFNLIFYRTFRHYNISKSYSSDENLWLFFIALEKSWKLLLLLIHCCQKFFVLIRER